MHVSIDLLLIRHLIHRFVGSGDAGLVNTDQQ